MEREKAIAILRFYRDIPKSIKLNEREIRSIEDQYYTTLDAVKITGAPGGKGDASSPVEKAALKIPQAVSRNLESLNRKNDRLERIGYEIRAAIDRLNYGEKAIILGFYIEGQTWERISARVNYSPRQCKNIRNRALSRLAKLFAQNPAILKFPFPEK